MAGSLPPSCHYRTIFCCPYLGEFRDKCAISDAAFLVLAGLALGMPAWARQAGMGTTSRSKPTATCVEWAAQYKTECTITTNTCTGWWSPRRPNLSNQRPSRASYYNVLRRMCDSGLQTIAKISCMCSRDRRVHRISIAIHLRTMFHPQCTGNFISDAMKSFLVAAILVCAVSWGRRRCCSALWPVVTASNGHIHDICL